MEAPHEAPAATEDLPGLKVLMTGPDTIFHKRFKERIEAAYLYPPLCEKIKKENREKKEHPVVH